MLQTSPRIYMGIKKIIYYYMNHISYDHIKQFVTFHHLQLDIVLVIPMKNLNN